MKGFIENILLSAHLKIRKFYLFEFSIRRIISIRGLCFALISVCHLSCSGNPEVKEVQSETANNLTPIQQMQDSYNFPYELDNPESRYNLPSYLVEISGIAYFEKKRIACIQDEKANIYVVNLDKEEVVEKYDFGKDADYEDIAIIENTAFVLRNDGQIFKVEDFRKKNPKVKKYKTPLSEKNDTEGLAYDPLTNSLLIACKGSPSIDKNNPFKDHRAVYQFNLNSKDLVRTPHFLIDLENLESYNDHSTFTRFSLNLAKKLHLIDSYTSFQPSGIAIHPIHGDIYIISSVGKLLIVLDRRGKILDIHELDVKLFRQPEGISFSPSGDLFISSEGQGGKGYILKFKKQDR
jgi:uncharacterized protein YjiK